MSMKDFLKQISQLVLVHSDLLRWPTKSFLVLKLTSVQDVCLIHRIHFVCVCVQNFTNIFLKWLHLYFMIYILFCQNIRHQMGLIECLCLFQLWAAWSEPVAEHHLSADESPDLCSQEEQGQQWVTPILTTASLFIESMAKQATKWSMCVCRCWRCWWYRWC